MSARQDAQPMDWLVGLTSARQKRSSRGELRDNGVKQRLECNLRQTAAYELGGKFAAHR